RALQPRRGTGRPYRLVGSVRGDSRHVLAADRPDPGNPRAGPVLPGAGDCRARWHGEPADSRRLGWPPDGERRWKGRPRQHTDDDLEWNLLPDRSLGYRPRCLRNRHQILRWYWTAFEPHQP